MAFSTPITISTFAAFGPNGGTTAAADTAAAAYDLIIIVCGGYATGTQTIADSASNTWRAHPNNGAFTALADTASMWWKEAPTLSAAHTFTSNAANSYPSLIVIGVTGSYVAGDPKDQTNSAVVEQGAGTTIQPGSITPTQDNELLICGLAGGAAAAADMTIAGNSFTKLTATNFVGSGSIASAAGYVIQTSAGAANPTWTCTTSTIGLVSLVASFKELQAVGGPFGNSLNVTFGLPQMYRAGRNA